MSISRLYIGENIGGLAKIEFCHVSDLISIQPLVFKYGKCFETISFLTSSANFKDDETDSIHGILFTYAGAFKRQFPSKDDELLFDQYIGSCTVFKITDMNGVSFLLGENNNPVTLVRSSDRGSKPSDMAFHEFKFSITQSKRAI